ncbi:hypothetical protein PPTG_23979 [Phytophthora nicotianae INRA-310]|uniref:DDE Tnp4 domain-containing protein n=1 Tax=Phytophthora nicotianae (strain INRA-310) TaxID=761204 RepID=W2PMP6_PHYN3|nr:hypothetical protein PPTG_23979 [Phytophthora nicotianae INRA-310]ETN01891.1 hypothetical protein PPTG_23979 [Phytophthora nicotianae INRA-310]
MHPSSEKAQTDSQVTSFIRSVTRGVPRHYKTAYLLQRLQRAREDDLYVEAAMILAELACQPAPSKQTPSTIQLQCLIRLVPVRWEDVREFFGRSPSGLSNIFLHQLDVLEAQYADLVLLTHEIAASRLFEYARAVFDVGSPYTNIWAFIDGTVRGICRPTSRRRGRKKNKLLDQQSVYNGHKRKHALKFQTLVTPNGLISHLCGPYPGRNHDIKTYRESDLSTIIRNDLRFREYRNFGDCAYGRGDVLISPFDGAIGNLTPEQRHINSALSKIRVSVEWPYAQIVNY